MWGPPETTELLSRKTVVTKMMTLIVHMTLMIELMKMTLMYLMTLMVVT